MKLFKTHSLTFTIPSTGGYPGIDGKWVYPAANTSVVEGSLQSFGKGVKTLTLPEGYRTEDTKLFFTKVDIPTQQEVLSTEAATTTIGGRVYTAFDKEDNTGFNLPSDHYLIVLIREPQDNGEGW